MAQIIKPFFQGTSTNIFREIEAIGLLALGSTFTGLMYREAADLFIGLGFVQLNVACLLYLIEFNQPFRDMITTTNLGVDYHLLFNTNVEEETSTNTETAKKVTS